ncbi:MAG: FGGY family carbohydrate kinase, partial [Chloroflexia bacterium]
MSLLSQSVTFLAIDLGASSGRVIACRWDGERFTLHELHRFPNSPVEIDGHLHWDIERLWDEILTGIASYAAENSDPPAGIGVDTWAVDFVLLDSEGNLLSNPYNYRNYRTDGMPEQVDRTISPQELYAETGIQRLPINTLYQLASMRGDRQLLEADTFLMIPDLFHYWLTGRKVAEYTNATTTQFYSAKEGSWATELLETLGLPTNMLPEIVS